jgi:ferredoxin-NADP reductase
MQATLPRVATRPYKVVRKVRESEVITSFYLVPADGEPLTPFKPGQFLTFQMPDPARGGIVRRNYSLSGSPSAEHYRISVKREGAPAAPEGCGPGLFSTHLHDGIDVGSELLARGPDGRFVLDTSHDRPVVLLSGGVCLTPLVAMAHALALGGGRKAHFIHACDNGRVHALAAELRELVAGSPSLRSHICYRNPTEADLLGRDYDSKGVITTALLQALLPLDDYDFYLCGPGPFMQSVFAQLIELGVREERIRYEFFGPATLLRAEQPAAAKSETPIAEAAPAASVSVTDTPMVTFSGSGRTVAWDPTFETLLDFAEAQGLSPAFSCRAGICATCLCDLPSGEVDYVAEPLEQPEPGKVLLCCSRPRGDVTIAV